MPDSDPADFLSPIRERTEGQMRKFRDVDASQRDVPRLLAAVDAALKLHGPGRVTILGALCERHENHRYFSITATEADGVRACQDCAATAYTSCAGCGPQVGVDACPTRAAITTALTREAPDAR